MQVLRQLFSGFDEHNSERHKQRMTPLVSLTSLDIYSGALLVGPSGLMEACRNLGPIGYDDHRMLVRLLPALSEALSDEGIPTSAWSIPVREYVRTKELGKESQAKLRQIASGLRGISLEAESSYQRAVDRATAFLMKKKEALFFPVEKMEALQNIVYANPVGHALAAWVDRFFGDYRDAAEDFGQMADGYRIRGDVVRARRFYFLEAENYFRSAMKFSDRSQKGELVVAALHFKKSALAYLAADNELRAKEAGQRKREMEEKALEASEEGPSSPRFLDRLFRGLSAFFEYAEPVVGRDAGRTVGDGKSGRHLRLVKK